MLCKELQTKIAVQETLTSDEERHVRECAACAPFAAFDAGLSTRLEGWRDPLVAPVRRRTPTRAPRLALAGVGLAAAFTFAILALPTRSTAREAYGRMLEGTRQVTSVHLVVRWRPGDGRVEDGPLRTRYELWWRPGAWREKWEGLRPSVKREEEGQIMFYRYDPSTKTVPRMHESAEQPDFRQFELASFAGQYMATPTRFEQPSPTTLVATNAGDWSRMVFTLDPATRLPIHAEKQSRDTRGAWQVAGELDMEFNRSILDGRFDPESLLERSKP